MMMMCARMGKESQELSVNEREKEMQNPKWYM